MPAGRTWSPPISYTSQAILHRLHTQAAPLLCATAAVVLEPPRLADLPRWEGCFISSTSRLLLPVDEASVFAEEVEDGAAQGACADGASSTADAVARQGTRRFARGGLVQRLEQLVLAEVAACSEPLF